MSTVINDYKFSKYKFTTEKCYEEKDFDSEVCLKDQVYNIICAEGVTSEVASYLMSKLEQELIELTSNPSFSHLSFDNIFTYDKITGFNHIVICDENLWYLVMGLLLNR